MTDPQQTEDDAELQEPKVAPSPAPAPAAVALPTEIKAPRTQVSAQSAVMALVPRNLDEAWKMADAFKTAGMVPRSLEGKTDQETKAKLMLAICKGAELGYGPVTAVGTIMVINGKACIYGDGATALVQNSGKVDWIKTSIDSTTGKWGEGYKVTVSLKRRDRNHDAQKH